MEKTTMVKFIERVAREDGTKSRVGSTQILPVAEARKLVDDGVAVIADIGPSETKPSPAPAETKSPTKTAKK